MSKTKKLLYWSLVIIGALCILNLPLTVRGQEGSSVEGLEDNEDDCEEMQQRLNLISLMEAGYKNQALRDIFEKLGGKEGAQARDLYQELVEQTVFDAINTNDTLEDQQNDIKNADGEAFMEDRQSSWETTDPPSDESSKNPFEEGEDPVCEDDEPGRVTGSANMETKASPNFDKSDWGSFAITDYCTGSPVVVEMYDGQGNPVYKGGQDSSLACWQEKHGNGAGEGMWNGAVKHERNHVKQLVKDGPTDSVDKLAKRELECYEIEREVIKKKMWKLHCSDISEWRGTLSLEVTRRFQCNVQEKTSEIGHEEIRANDEHTQKVNITIGMDDFDLAINPSIPGTNLIREASGEMQCMISEDHFTAGRLEKTECHKEGGGGGRSWEWVSPGNWSTNHETLTGQASRTIKKENINLLIVKDIELNKEAMENLQQQMQEAAQNNDMAAIQKLKGQMVSMVQGDQDNNVIPVRIRIEIVFDITKKDIITKTFDRKSYNVCLKKNEDESGTNTIELPIALPMGAEMKGTYTRGKDGSDTIMATINMTETSYCMFYTDICPDATTTINGQINLERQ